MRRTPLIALVLLSIALSGCVVGAATVHDLKNKASLREKFEVNLNWQEATKITKQFWNDSSIITMNCTIYTELGESECITDKSYAWGSQREHLVMINIKKIDDGKSSVEMYSYFGTSAYVKLFNDMKTKLLSEAVKKNNHK